MSKDYSGLRAAIKSGKLDKVRMRALGVAVGKNPSLDKVDFKEYVEIKEDPSIFVKRMNIEKSSAPVTKPATKETEKPKNKFFNKDKK